MKHPKILVPTLALALSVGGTAAAAAQSYPSTTQTPSASRPELTPEQRRVKMLLEGIVLSTQQAAKIDSIQVRYAKQAPMPTGNAMDSTALAAIHAMQVRQDTEIRAVLTPEQQKAWDRNKDALSKQRGS